MFQAFDDPALHSGPWTGFWLQPETGSHRHRMDLDLRFRDGAMIGVGCDQVGPFWIHGTYDQETNEIRFLKRYSTHGVNYRGFHEVQHGVYGSWSLVGSGSKSHGGGFRIWPVHRSDGIDQTIEAEQHAPAVFRRRTAMPVLT